MIEAYRVNHNVLCYGYCSAHASFIGRFDAARAKEQGIPLKFWNPLQKGQTITDGDRSIRRTWCSAKRGAGSRSTVHRHASGSGHAEYAKDADLMICREHVRRAG